MMKRVFVVLAVLLFVGLNRVDSVRVSELSSCPIVSMKDAIFGFQDSICRFHHSYDPVVIEGDEEVLQRAMHLVHSRKQEYIAVLFYASWCPFSSNFRPSFSILSILYPSIPHFAIEESAVMPSVLSTYGIHGFPSIILLNSTMYARYRGSRSLSSLVYFYSDVTGMEGDPRDELPFDKIEKASKQEIKDSEDLEDYPFSWARSIENLFRQETYLALATTFVLLEFMYFLIPCVFKLAHCTWRRYMPHVRITAFWEHPLRYLNKTKQVVSSFRIPRKGRNFQEGAINARAWASKSLASAVSATPSASH